MPGWSADDSTLLNQAHHAIYSHLPLPSLGKNPVGLSDNARMRLVVLRAGVGSQDIACDLEVVELNTNQHYQALSYVWGDEHDVKLITCCGQPLAITRNLFTALRYLRKPDAYRRLWIDAICIDQKDLRERGEQVSLMGRIYGAAQNVVVWLGEPHDEDASAFDTIVELSASIPERKRKRWSRSKTQNIPKAEINSYIKVNRLQFRQLLVFLSRPWFERVWVIQEVVRSRQAVVLCGKRELPWDQFAKVVVTCSDALSYLVAKYPQESLDQVTAFDNLAAIDSLRKDNEKMSLFAILCVASTFKSTDERDKLFALLNLGNRSSVRISPDYTLSYFEVFKRHAKYELTIRHRLDYLARPPVTHAAQEWPSWIPDWTEKSRSSYFYTAMDHSFHAAAGTTPELLVNDSNNVLCIKGVIVDTVAELIEPMDRSRLHQDVSAESVNSVEIIQWLEKCLALVPLQINLIPDAAESALEPLLRTFACVGVYGPTSRNFASIRRPTVHTADLKRSLKSLAAAIKSDAYSVQGQDALLKAVTEFALQLYPAVTDRQFLRTNTLKRFGWVSKRAHEGDVVCVLYGGPVPFVLRQMQDNLWRIVGECYVDGLMEGEAIKKNIGSIVDFQIC